MKVAAAVVGMLLIAFVRLLVQWKLEGRRERLAEERRHEEDEQTTA